MRATVETKHSVIIKLNHKHILIENLHLFSHKKNFKTAKSLILMGNGHNKIYKEKEQ